MARRRSPRRFAAEQFSSRFVVAQKIFCATHHRARQSREPGGINAVASFCASAAYLVKKDQIVSQFGDFDVKVDKARQERFKRS